MLGLLAFILAAVAVIVTLQFLADRTGLPAAALLTVAGLLYGVLPGPNITLDPHVILTFVIPPLIYTAALNSSLLAIRENLRAIISLSIGLVLATAVITGIGMDLFVPGVGVGARRLGKRVRPGRGEGYLSGREIGVLSWAGTRGVISLAAIFTLPLAAQGNPFPDRDLLLFCTYLVVVVTLVGQGLSFAPVARALGVRADLADAALVRTQARAAAVQAAMSRLDQMAGDEDAPGAALAALRTSLDHKARRYDQLLGRLEAGEDAEPPATPEYQAALRARRAVIDAQREELLRWRDAGHLPDSSLRILERELDYEERTLPPHEDLRPGG